VKSLFGLPSRIFGKTETTNITMQRMRLKLITNLFKLQPSLYINENNIMFLYSFQSLCKFPQGIELTAEKYVENRVFHMLWGVSYAGNK
jgi:hypothetical protein